MLSQLLRVRERISDTSSAVWTAWLGESEAPDYCINQNIFYYCAAAVNIGSDVLIALIPIPQLWKLRFSLRKKLLLSAVFSVGFM
jgi:hypothetical protein